MQPGLSIEAGERMLQGFKTSSRTLDPSIILAAKSSQPPLPPSALSQLPYPKLPRQPNLGPLKVNDPDVVPSLLRQPPHKLTSKAFNEQATLLGCFSIPLVAWNGTDKGAATGQLLKTLSEAVRCISDGKLKATDINLVSSFGCERVRGKPGVMALRAFNFTQQPAAYAYGSSPAREANLYLTLPFKTEKLKAKKQAPPLSALCSSIETDQAIGVNRSDEDLDEAEEAPRQFMGFQYMLPRSEPSKAHKRQDRLDRLEGLGDDNDMEVILAQSSLSAGGRQAVANLSPLIEKGLVSLVYYLIAPDGTKIRVRNIAEQVSDESKLADKKEGEAEGKGPSSGAWSLQVQVYSLPRLLRNLQASHSFSDDMGLDWESKDGGGASSTAIEKREAIALSVRFSHLIQDLLLYGSGLWVGPDCDGLSNFNDPPGSAPLLSHEEQALVASAQSSETAAQRTLGNNPNPGPSTSLAAAEEEEAASPSPLQWLPASKLPPSLFSVSSTLASGNLTLNQTSTQPGDQAPCPPGVKTSPKPFQLQGLQWMLRRERLGEATGRSLIRLSPFWRQFVTSDGFVFYLRHVPDQPSWITLSFTPAPLSGTCGGL